MKFHRIVVLIDADNTNLANLEKLIQYISTRGRIVVKRAYGNWSENLKDKKSALQQSGFKTEHYFNCVPGKNATDIALAIDAVDLLHKNSYDSFVIVSSDSDFTPLSIYLKESGVYVIGFGKSNASEAFRNGCDEFKDIEKIPTSESNSQHLKNTAPSATKKDPLEIIHKHLQQCAIDNKKDDGYTSASDAGKYLRQHILGFTPKTYRYKNLTNLLEDFRNLYAIEKHPIPGNKNSVNVSYKLCNSTNNSES